MAACALLLVLVAAWLWSRSGRATHVRPGEVDLAAPSRAGGPALALVPLAPPDPPGEGSRAPAEAAAPEPESASASTVRSMAPAAFVLRGTLSVSDPRGAPLPAVDGTLDLHLWKPHGPSIWSATELQATVRAGEWSVQVPDPGEHEHLSIVGVSSGEATLAVLSPRERLGLSEAPLHVLARVRSDLVLRVVDASTGSDLDGIGIVMAAPSSEDRAAHPGPDPGARVVRSGVRSPVVLPEDLRSSHHRTAELLVGAEGYAWTPVSLDVDVGGERMVSLLAGGDLEILARGVTAAGTMLRVRQDAGSELLASVPLTRDGPIALRGLRPGDASVRAEVGPWYDRPLVLGETEARILAGAETRVVLDLMPPPPLELASASGIARLPVAWGRTSLQVELELLDTPLKPGDTRHSVSARRSAPEGGLDTFHWRFRDLQAGSYRLSSGDPPYSIVIDVRPGANEGFELRVPPPAVVALRVLDAWTGEPIPDARVWWNPVWPEGVDGGGLEDAELDPATGLHRIRAPECAIDVTAGAPSHSSQHLRMTPPFEREPTLRLERACGFELTLQDGETSIPFPEPWSLSGVLVELPGERRPPIAYDGRKVRILLEEPGTYTVHVPKVDGYRQPAPRQVVVPRGEVTRLVIRLEREHP